MPKIKWLRHPNPAKQHLNGTIDYPTREEVAPYLLSGQAVLVNAEKPRYGSTEWMEEKQAKGRALNPPCTEARVTWGIKFGTFNKRPAITASCSNPICTHFRYEGPTFKVGTNKKGVKERVLLSLDFIVFTHSCGALFPENVPAHVVEEYRKAYAEGNFLLTPDESKMYTALAQASDSNKRVDLVAVGYVKKGQLEF
jgi:hypothetical protein